MKVYRGTPKSVAPRGGYFVEVCHPGQNPGNGTRLHHFMRHSPDGFSWGYSGSGPAELARCLLIDAMGADAKCPTCGGTGVIRDETDQWKCTTCWATGFSPLVEDLYQDFKFQVVANWDQHQPWSLTDEFIRGWVKAAGTALLRKSASPI